MSIPLLKEGIREIVEDLGTVLDIRAGKSLKQRGQAFVVYSSVEEATEAHDILQDIELFGRKIQVQYARARSDATVQKDDGEEALAEHKKVRLAEKGEYTMNHTYNTGPSADHLASAQASSRRGQTRQTCRRARLHRRATRQGQQSRHSRGRRLSPS